MKQANNKKGKKKIKELKKLKGNKEFEARTNTPIATAMLSWLLSRGLGIFRIFFCLVGDYDTEL